MVARLERDLYTADTQAEPDTMSSPGDLISEETTMTFPERHAAARTAPSPRPVINRPDVRLPPGYSPNSSLPPGYQPPHRDLQRSGTLARSARKTTVSRRQAIILALGGLGLILAIVVIATLVISTIVLQNTVGSAETTLDTYYSALRTQDYTHAYDQLSPTFRSSQTRDNYISQHRQLDVLGGPVVKYSIEHSATNGNHATATVTSNRANSLTSMTVDTIALVKVNGGWYIDSFTSQQESVPSTP